MTHPQDSSSTLTQLMEYTRKTTLLATAQATLEWDERTGLPSQAGEYRAQQATLLSGMIHARQTDPQLGIWLEELIGSPHAEDPHSPAGASLRRLHKDFRRHCKVPQSLVEALTRATMLGQQAWSQARQHNDFQSFQAPLTEIVRLRREEATLLRTTENSLYDVLLDQYEDNAESQQIQQVFADLQGPLVNLVKQTQAAHQRPNGGWLAREFPLDMQRQASHWIAEQIGYDFSRGRLDETDHPFCTTLGPNDHRILTRYQLQHFNSGFFGTLHEAGHAMYEQGLPTDWFGFAAGQPASLGIHESQSRLWENMVGRSHAFWKWCFPQMQKRFPAALGACRLDDFYRDINCVEPSLIRVEADEATYNLHILIRFELEKELIDGSLTIADLPAAWNARYEQHLGILPDSDANGVLQDIHWSAALIGYFPTYTLGNIYAAQLLEAATNELGDLDPLFEKGEFQPLLEWLRLKIHRWGHCYDPTTLMQRATGQPLSSRPLMQYLKGKLGPVYGLSESSFSS